MTIDEFLAYLEQRGVPDDEVISLSIWDRPALTTSFTLGEFKRQVIQNRLY